MALFQVKKPPSTIQIITFFFCRDSDNHLKKLYYLHFHDKCGIRNRLDIPLNTYYINIIILKSMSYESPKGLDLTTQSLGPVRSPYMGSMKALLMGKRTAILSCHQFIEKAILILSIENCFLQSQRKIIACFSTFVKACFTK